VQRTVKIFEICREFIELRPGGRVGDRLPCWITMASSSASSYTVVPVEMEKYFSKKQSAIFWGSFTREEPETVRGLQGPDRPVGWVSWGPTSG
jgi:hypothetical protein